MLEATNDAGRGSQLSLLQPNVSSFSAGIGMEDGAAPAAHSSEELSAIQSELSQLRAELGVEGGGGDSVELVIKTLTGQHVNVRCPADGTVRDVKATIAAQAVRAAASPAAPPPPLPDPTPATATHAMPRGCSTLAAAHWAAARAQGWGEE